MKYLLDTNAITAWAKKNEGFIQRLTSIAPAELCMSVMTEHELRYGIASNPALRLKPMVEQLIAVVPRLAVDSDVASCAATVRADLRRRGLPIGSYDLLIAATALARNLTVVTGNTREFSRVEGIRLENWLQSTR